MALTHGVGGKLTKFRGHKEITENHESFYPRKFLAIRYQMEFKDVQLETKDTTVVIVKLCMMMIMKMNIGCKECDKWFHGDCVGITPDNEPDKYYCASCL